MKTIKYLFVLTFCLWLAGCASGAKMDAMIYQGEQKQYAAGIQQNMGIGEVSGGRWTNPLWTSQIDNKAFSGALKESLLRQGLYSDAGKYRLEVEILKVDQPMFGMNFKVTTFVRYKLVEANGNKVLWDETVIAPHTAGVGDALIAVRRLRLANEGSAKRNIEVLLEKLSQLNIEPREVSLVE